MGESSDASDEDGTGQRSGGDERGRERPSDDGGADERPSDEGGTREQFWDLVCKYAVYFYVLLMMVTVFLVMNLLVLALVPSSSLTSDVRTGSLIVIALNFVILLGTALGIVYILRVCNRYTTPESDDGL